MQRVIGANVKAARTKANLTQECLAEIAGIHWQTISYIENGKFPASIVTFAKLSQALDVSTNRLLEGLPPLNPARTARIKSALARKRKPRA
ncbi:MAG: helix-turn-helix transcriptional regulator [Verrucomicrobiota bacterium]